MNEDQRILTPATLTRLLAISHRSAFQTCFAWRSRRWRDAAGESPPPSRIVLSGFLNEVLGIGQAGRLTAAALAAADIAVIEEDLRPFDRGLLTRSPVDLPNAPIWLIHANPPEARIALYRHTYASWKDRYRIGYWAWESSVAPKSWVGPARWFHEIWTPSQSARDAFARAFKAAGEDAQVAKLRVVPHPVTVAPRLDRSLGSDVRALVLFDPRSDFDRKNPEGAVEAWLRAFPTPGAPRLIVKSLAEAEGHPRLESLRRLAAQRDDIEIRAETLTPQDTLALVAGCHILISLHRAEGFGLPLAEAMALGLTVIATGWSGNMQFMTADNSIPVPYRLVAANSRYNGPRAQWAEPDITAAATALQQAAVDADLRDRLGRRARADISRLTAAWSPAVLFPSPHIPVLISRP